MTVVGFNRGNANDVIDFGKAKDEAVPCFTRGAMIATPTGEVAVENLRVGDRVFTRDNGVQVIRWIGDRKMSKEQLAQSPESQPIMIREGALGQGMPCRDMVVSPDHQMLMSSDLAQSLFDEREVLVAAKDLGKLKFVGVAAVETVEYFHILFDDHEIILADGAWTESLQPTKDVMKAVGKANSAQIVELFPKLKDLGERETGFASARRSLRSNEARLLFV